MWWGRLQEGALEAIQRPGPGEQLFDAFYPLICQDRGEVATGTLAHKEQVRGSLAAAREGAAKGHKVATNRWFSWCLAAKAYLPVWWERMCLLTFIGMKTGVYRTAADVPLWQAAAPPPGPAEDTDEEEDRAEQAATAVAASAAVAEAAAAEPSKAVAQSNQELSKLRARCKNALYVAATVMAMDNIHSCCKLLLLLVGPLYDQHSENAREARSVDGVLSFYSGAAAGSFLAPLRRVVSLLQDIHSLGFAGFATDWARFSTKAKAKRLAGAAGMAIGGPPPQVQAEQHGLAFLVAWPVGCLRWARHRGQALRPCRPPN
eukprot:13089700-Alexandrium_andersonii.AAC.1